MTIELGLGAFVITLPLTLLIVAAATLTAARRDRGLVLLSTGLLVVCLAIFGVVVFGAESGAGAVPSWRYALAGALAGLPLLVVNVAAGMVGAVSKIGSGRVAIGTLIGCVLAMPAVGLAILGAECTLGNCL